MAKVLFISKSTSWCDQAEKFVRQKFTKDILVIKGSLGEPLPKAIEEWSGDILISYLSPWIIPKEVLEQSTINSVNFHPGPPEYPGIGCYNFALYDGVDRYGVTAHEMASKVDTGPIIAVRYFQVDPIETVWSLKEKSMGHMLDLFKDVIGQLAQGNTLRAEGLTWTRSPYTRRELNELCRLKLSMGEKEIARRIRAVSFPGAPGAWLEINGYCFEHINPSSITKCNT